MGLASSLSSLLCLAAPLRPILSRLIVFFVIGVIGVIEKLVACSIFIEFPFVITSHIVRDCSRYEGLTGVSFGCRFESFEDFVQFGIQVIQLIEHIVLAPLQFAQ